MSLDEKQVMKAFMVDLAFFLTQATSKQIIYNRFTPKWINNLVQRLTKFDRDSTPIDWTAIEAVQQQSWLRKNDSTYIGPICDLNH